MRVASTVLFDCICCSGVSEFQATSTATCMSLTVMRLNCLFSPTLTDVPKELILPESPSRVCSIPDQRRAIANVGRVRSDCIANDRPTHFCGYRLPRIGRLGTQTC